MNVYLVIEAGDMADKKGNFGSLYWESIVRVFSNQTKAHEYCREQFEIIENSLDNEILDKTENQVIYKRNDGKKLWTKLDVKKMKVE